MQVRPPIITIPNVAQRVNSCLFSSAGFLQYGVILSMVMNLSLISATRNSTENCIMTGSITSGQAGIRMVKTNHAIMFTAGAIHHGDLIPVHDTMEFKLEISSTCGMVVQKVQFRSIGQCSASAFIALKNVDDPWWWTGPHHLTSGDLTELRFHADIYQANGTGKLVFITEIWKRCVHDPQNSCSCDLVAESQFDAASILTMVLTSK